MPGNRRHHTDKMHRCVGHVLEQGHDESSAWAICTASLQGAGEPIFEEDDEPRSAMGDTRNLHLLGATGTARVEQLDGRDHLVVPCVALQETVIHAVNAPCAEMVPLETLHKAADSFNNKPVVFGHPVKDGKQISANDPLVLAQHGMGTIRNSRVVGSRLLMDAYLDPIKVEKIAGPTILQRMKDGKDHFEISVGAFVHTEDAPGVHNGKGYKAIWRDTSGDHLAFLTGVGACSVAAGCGSHRMMERHLVTAEGMHTLAEELTLRACAGELPIEVETKLWELAFGKPEAEVRAAIGARHSASDLAIVQSIHDYSLSLGAKCESEWKYLEGSEGRLLGNPNHAPAGGSDGGQFTSGKGGKMALPHGKVSEAHAKEMGLKPGDYENIEGVGVMGRTHEEQRTGKATAASSTADTRSNNIARDKKKNQSHIEHNQAAKAHTEAAKEHEAVGNKEKASSHKEKAAFHRNQSKKLRGASEYQEYLETLGGPGSGNFGHAGRPGSVGGSASKSDSGAGGSEYERSIFGVDARDAPGMTWADRARQADKVDSIFGVDARDAPGMTWADRARQEDKRFKRDIPDLSNDRQFLTNTPDLSNDNMNQWGKGFVEWQKNNQDPYAFKNNKPTETSHIEIGTGSPAEHMNQWGKEFVQWQQSEKAKETQEWNNARDGKKPSKAETQEWNNARDGSKPGGRVNLNEYERTRRSFKPKLGPQSTFPIRKQVEF